MIFSAYRMTGDQTTELYHFCTQPSIIGTSATLPMFSSFLIRDTKKSKKIALSHCSKPESIYMNLNIKKFFFLKYLLYHSLNASFNFVFLVAIMITTTITAMTATDITMICQSAIGHVCGITSVDITSPQIAQYTVDSP